MKEREKKTKKKTNKGKKKEQEWMKRTEDINKNNFYVRVGIQELEGLLNLLLCFPPSLHPFSSISPYISPSLPLSHSIFIYISHLSLL